MSEVKIIKHQPMSVSFYRPENKFKLNNKPEYLPPGKKWVMVKLARLHQKREMLKNALVQKQLG